MCLGQIWVRSLADERQDEPADDERDPEETERCRCPRVMYAVREKLLDIP